MIEKSKSKSKPRSVSLNNTSGSGRSISEYNQFMSPELDGNDMGLQSIRDRFPLKRHRDRSNVSSDRPSLRSRLRRHRKFRGSSVFFYFLIIIAVFSLALASVLLQTSLSSVRERGRSLREGFKFGNTFKFMPHRRFTEGRGLAQLRSQARVGVRPPRLALILGNLEKDPHSLMLFTVMKSLRKLGYILKIYVLQDGKAHPVWKQICSEISILGPKQYGHIEWSIFEGIIADSLEAKDAISSLMREPFCSIPLIWIVQEDTLGNRLLAYEEMGWKDLVSYWKQAFSRADVIVFPDFSLPMLYSVLDTGNFFVIPGSPVDVWAAESYSSTHSKYQLRSDAGFTKDDMLVLVVGSSFFYNELSWDYAVAMHTIGPLLNKYARRSDAGGSFKFAFLCGNSTDGYDDALQEVSSHLGLLPDSVRHYGMNGDVNSVLLMADIILYGSSQDEQGFPSLLTRAMTFGIPVLAPDLPILRKYVIDGSHLIFFQKHNPDDLMKAFSLLISNGNLSKFAKTIGSSGRLHAKNMQASECITSYAKLLENVLNFPSDASLPGPISQLQQGTWEWNMFRKEVEERISDGQSLDENVTSRKSSVVYALEDQLAGLTNSKTLSENKTELDVPTELDWDGWREIEKYEEYEKIEMEELEERMEKDSDMWDDVYRNARKAEKVTRFELNERDEGELERTGQLVCIYEIYSGTGAWTFLHHGSLYRGLSLSRRSQRLTSDDVDAVSRLPLLNDSYYRDILCDMGGMFSIANKVDNIHRRPWIGFQSWRAAGRKVSLSMKAERVLGETIQQETKGDIMYFWAHVDMDTGVTGRNHVLSFWSMCDILNGGHCRTAFERAFRKLYSLPSSVEALPPMPEDGGRWSALHSWVMPTPSYLEFIMFSRMFADSLNSLHMNSSKVDSCLLGSSETEKKHCYCRVLELLVNVWAYHSARKMVYIDPSTGSLEEQHPIEQRKGSIWAKYFDYTLLKSMDEDLSEAADDNDHLNETWLWPLTGQVHWRGVYEKEREERYRAKMDKKRKTREKLYERLKHGYRQKTLGG